SDELADVERPTARPRAAVLAPDRAAAVVGAVKDRAFGELLEFLHETGGRPSGAAAVEASMFDRKAGAGGLAAKKRPRAGRKRIIYLTPRAAEILERRAAEWPEGPLFRNLRGRAWTRNAMACRFARMRKREGMGPEATAESFRHVWVTDALERGVP